jgi:hypothetical protein
MVKIEHNLKFVTEVDETHPTAIRLLELPEVMMIGMLESMLKEMVAPALDETLEHINEGNTWAVLKVAE